MVEAFLARLDACAAGEAAFTLQLDDPAGNSYVEAGAAGADADPLLSLECFRRSREQARTASTGSPCVCSRTARPQPAASTRRRCELLHVQLAAYSQCLLSCMQAMQQGSLRP